MASRAISIKSRIIVTLVLVPLVSLLLMGIIALVQNQDALTRQTEESLGSLVREKTIGYDAVFRRIAQEAESAGAYASLTYDAPAPREDAGWKLLMPWTGSGYGNDALQRSLRDETLRLQRIGQFLKAVVASNPYLTLGYFATQTGITVFNQQDVVAVISAVRGFDPRQRPWYLKARDSTTSVWTDLYVDVNTKKLTVTAATPVRDASQKLIGVVGFDVLLETLQKDILNVQIGYRNEPFLINRTGTVIVRRGMDERNTQWDTAYKTDNLMSSKNDGFRNIVIRMTGGLAGIQSFTGDDGQQNYLAYAPVPTVNASLGIIVPRSEIVRPVRENGKLVLLAMAVFVLISVGAGVWLGNQVSRPLQELTLLVDKASKGLVELDEVPVRRRDEVGVLAAAFNRMLANLATVQRELEEREGKKQ